MSRPLRVDELCQWKPRPGLPVVWRLGRLLELERHHARLQPLRQDRGELRPQGEPVRLPLQLVRAVQKRALAMIRVASAAAGTSPARRSSRAAETEAPYQPPPPSATILPGDLPSLAPVLISRAGPVSLRARPKPLPPVRSPEFLGFVRWHPCCSCPAPADVPLPLLEEEGPRSDPHHHGPRGVSQKTDDLRSVPLCRRCHNHVHRTGCLPGRDRAQTLILLYRVQVDLLVAFYGRGGPP